MKVRAVALDVDGTLICESGNVLDPEYFTAIRKLQKMGIRVIINSGRHLDSQFHLFAPIKDELYYIGDNGAVAGTSSETEIIHTMDDQAAKELIRISRELPGIEMIANTADQSFIDPGISDSFFALLKSYRFECRKIPLDSLNDLVKVALYHDNDIEGVAGHLISRWPGKIYGVRSGEWWIDFIPPGISKAKTLSDVLARHGISLKETVAVGDNMNDLDMIRMAGYGCAVANAREECLQAADRILPSYEDKGVLTLLEELIAGGGEIE